MSMPVLVVAVLALAAIVLFKFLKHPSTPNKPYPYQSRRVLFTPAERSFLGVLEQVLDAEYRVMGKVRLCDIIEVTKGLSKSDRQSAHNKIDRKHLDFVIMRRSDLSVAAVVELDDKTHKRKDRKSRDDFLDKALAAAQIPFFRFPAQSGYRVEEVKARLEGIVTPAGEKENLPEPSLGLSTVDAAASENKVPAPDAQTGEPAVPVCEKCGAKMVKRQAKRGQHIGKWFWACTEFPKCRGVVAIEP